MFAYGTVISQAQLETIINKKNSTFLEKAKEIKRKANQDKDPDYYVYRYVDTFTIDDIIEDRNLDISGFTDLYYSEIHEVKEDMIAIFANGTAFCGSRRNNEFPYIIGWIGKSAGYGKGSQRLRMVPEKTKELIKSFCKENQLESPHYLLVENVCRCCT